MQSDHLPPPVFNLLTGETLKERLPYATCYVFNSTGFFGSGFFLIENKPHPYDRLNYRPIDFNRYLHLTREIKVENTSLYAVNRLFVVTNDHVYRGCVNGGQTLSVKLTFIEVEAGVGEDYTIGLRYGDTASMYIEDIDIGSCHCYPHWGEEHSVDLVKIDISMAVQLYQKRYPTRKLVYYAVSRDNIIREADLAKIHVYDKIVTVGYPGGKFDSHNNLPIVTSGKTASAPVVNWEGRPDILIDCTCMSGCSGSPVFVYRATSGSESVHLLSVIHRGYDHPLSRIDQQQRTPAVAAGGSPRRLPMNLGITVKAFKLLEYFEEPHELFKDDDLSDGDDVILSGSIHDNTLTGQPAFA
jgi:hypothetical protein